MARVSLKNLRKTYDNPGSAPLTVVHDINLEINDREFMVLVGPSGCGKSTTLRMIAGLEEISGGTIAIDDAIVNDVLPKDRDIAMVFQNYALYPHMTVYENMAFGLKLRKMPKPEIDLRVREAATMLGLEAYLERKPKALSGGQRQRVAVGRAIVRKPKVFLFDEPLSNLDAKMRVSTRTEIAKLHARLDATMVYVTHDQVEAMTMGDRICVMKDGRIMQVATPLELYRRPVNLFVAGFIGSPPMNFFRGSLTNEGGKRVFVEKNSVMVPLKLALPATTSAAVENYEGREIILGIRPENILEADASTEASDAEVMVELSEPMGAETMVYLTTGTTSFIGRFRPTEKYSPGQKTRVNFNAAQFHFFDPVTEQRID